MVWYVLLRPLRPELNGQDPFQICERLCQTLLFKILMHFIDSAKMPLYLQIMGNFRDIKVVYGDRYLYESIPILTIYAYICY
jgi:hypothetical protein